MIVPQQDGFLARQRRFRQAGAGAQEMRDLGEEPGPAVAAPADHHAVGAGAAQRVGGVVLGQDVAVDDDRDADRLLSPGR